MAGSSNYVKFDLTKEQAKLWAKLTKLQKSFVREYLSGKGKAESLKKAGSKGNPDSLRAGTGEILAKPCVKAFLDSIKPNLKAMAEDELNDSIMSREEALQRLTTYARCSMSDLVEFGHYEIEDGDGNAIKQSYWSIKDSKDISPEKLQAISELTSGPSGLKIKLHDPIKSINSISEMRKWKEEDDGQEEDIPTFADLINDLSSRS